VRMANVVDCVHKFFMGMVTIGYHYCLAQENQDCVVLI